MSLQFEGFISFQSISFRLTIKKIYKPAHGSLIKMTPKCCGMEGKLRGEQKAPGLLKASAHFTASPYFPALTRAGVDQRPSEVAVRCGREDVSGGSSESSWAERGTVQIHHRDSLIALGSWEFGGRVKAVGALSRSLSRY